MNKKQEHERVVWAVRKYASEKTDAWIAKGLKMPVARITKVRQRLGIFKLNKRRIKAIKAFIAKHSGTYSDRQISRSVHIQRRAVQRIRQRLGIRKAGTAINAVKRKAKLDKANREAYEASAEYAAAEQERIYREYGGGTVS